MKKLYSYMVSKLSELYKSEDKTVTIDLEHFFHLYRMVCNMNQIKNIINYDDHMEEMVKLIRGEENG